MAWSPQISEPWGLASHEPQIVPPNFNGMVPFCLSTLRQVLGWYVLEGREQWGLGPFLLEGHQALPWQTPSSSRLYPYKPQGTELATPCFPQKWLEQTYSLGEGDEEGRRQTKYLRLVPGDVISLSWQSLIFNSVIIFVSRLSCWERSNSY